MKSTIYADNFTCLSKTLYIYLWSPVNDGNRIKDKQELVWERDFASHFLTLT